jgi:hypothetical protein
MIIRKSILSLNNKLRCFHQAGLKINSLQGSKKNPIP